MTYPRAEELRAAARRIPLDRLLVETDAPYLTPQAVRKERNQPAFVVHTARADRRGARHRLRGPRGRGGADRRGAVRVVTAPRADPAERAAHAPVRHPAQPGAGAELPGRLQHPRGHRPGGGAGARGRGARDRRRPRRAVRVPRGARRARPRGRDRPAAGGGPARRHRPARQRHPPPRRCPDPGPHGAGSGADQGRRQPPLRDRHHGAAAHRGGAAVGDHLDRHGAARGRGAARRDAGLRRLRPAVGARPARLRRARGPQDSARGVLPGAERRLGARRPRAARARRAARGPRPRRRRLRPPSQGAAAVACARAAAPRPACATARGRPWRRWACRPTCAPNGSAPAQFRELAERLEGFVGP